MSDLPNSEQGAARPAVKYQFPPAWGADCPPTDAAAAERVVFRRVLNNPVDTSDFRSWIELGNRVTSADRQCQANGLSVFGLLADARAYAERYPGTGALIASAELKTEDGKIKATPHQGNSHITWWPFASIDRCRHFEVISL